MPDTTSEAERLRAALLTGFHILDEEGQNSGIAGHLTARLPGQERLLGHGYGLAFDEVRPETIHEADFALKVDGPGRVSPSLAFHVSIYRARPDVGAIVHTHGRHAIALGAAGAGFVPVYQSALMLWDRVRPYDRYDGIVESDDVGARMAEALGDGRVLALRNHGIVAVGATVAEAVCAAVIYEENCAMQLLALAAAGRALGLPEDEAADARDFLASPRVVAMRWQQLARKAARRRPFLPAPENLA
jgi:L-fuculose-phosphate aldolase